MKKAVVIPPYGEAYSLEVPSDSSSELAILQKAVGGWIELVPTNLPLSVYCNEEGKLNGLELNIRATQMFGDLLSPNDIIAGTVIVLGDIDDDGETLGLDDEMAISLVENAQRLNQEPLAGYSFPLPGGGIWMVCAYEFPDEQSAGVVWERIEKESRGKRENFSIWRTTTPDRSQWFIVTCGEPQHLPIVEGIPCALDYDQARSFVIRRARTGMDAFEKNPTDHFENRTRYGSHPVTIDPETGGVKPYND